MKLLLDQNLSRHLVSWLEQTFPNSGHVANLGLANASDLEIWEFARAEGYAILSKDSDFHHLSFLHGAPPKTVWVNLGNCSTKQVTACISRNMQPLMAFLNDAESALLVMTTDGIETG